MFTFLATIFIIYLVWLLVKPLLMSYISRKYTERVNDMFGQAFGGPPPGAGSRQQQQTSGSTSYGGGYGRRMKRKIFSRDEGEYVDFEEIDVKADYRAAGEQGRKYSPMEPQVSDVEWEDIK